MVIAAGLLRCFLIGIGRRIGRVYRNNRKHHKLGVVGDIFVSEQPVTLGVEDWLAVLVQLNDRFAVELGVFVAALIVLRLIFGVSQPDLHDFGPRDIPRFVQLELLLRGVLEQLLDERTVDETALGLVRSCAADGDDITTRHIRRRWPTLSRRHVPFECAGIFLAGVGGVVVASASAIGLVHAAAAAVGEAITLTEVHLL